MDALTRAKLDASVHPAQADMFSVAALQLSSSQPGPLSISNSAIYTGYVRHRRFLPILHSFRYRIFMMYLNLDELPQLFTSNWLWSAHRRNLAWFNRKDYYGNPQQPLKACIDELLQREIGQPAHGPICLLTNMRYFGHCFNPVSFYYCFEQDGSTLQAIVADINNTPWNERHAYVLDCSEHPAPIRAAPFHHFEFSKGFHVSPFMPMEIDYKWSFSRPSQALSVHMQNLVRAGKMALPLANPGTKMDNKPGKMFDATMQLTRQPINGKTLARMLLSYPFMTVTVITAIYWQALRLSLKRVPFLSHPKSSHPEP